MLSIEKVTLDIIVFFCDNKSEETKNRIRQIGKIIVILCCTILPRYHYDTIYDIIISISIIVLYIFFLYFLLKDQFTFLFVMMMKSMKRNPFTQISLVLHYSKYSLHVPIQSCII